MATRTARPSLHICADSPFGHSGCLDMKTLYATKARVPLRAAVKGRMPRSSSPAAPTRTTPWTTRSNRPS
ncbi:hypothetical protein AB0D54_03465 [Streptomyces xanthophaeus]|uniref:hypothetical protein n=1 Tax=Streptomyces xanthophaeus TaxID=67385 RepID=UPI00343797CE